MLQAIIQRNFKAPDDIQEMSRIGKFSQWFTIIIDMPIVFALLGLSFTIFLMIYNNKTQMEEIKGTVIAGSSADIQ